MVTVAEELPFVAVVDNGKLSTTCSNCFASTLGGSLDKPVDLKKCARCHTIYYCCKECQREDWKHHKDECTFLIRAKFCPEKYVRFISRTAMRIRKGDLPVAFNGRTFDDLMDHLDDIKSDRTECIGVGRLYIMLSEFMGMENRPSFEEVFSIYGMLRTNAFGIHSHDAIFEVGSGLYLGLSVHDHSCRPDCIYTFIGPKAILRAKDPNAKYSTELTCAYLDVTLPKEIRQERLQKTHFFVCQCARCMDKEEDLWERSGRSSCCPDGVVLPRDNVCSKCGKKKFRDPRLALIFLGEELSNKHVCWCKHIAEGEEMPLVCSKCGKKSSLTREQINDANEELEIFCDEVKKDELKKSITSLEEVDDYKKHFNKMERILSPYNLYFSKMSEVMGDIFARFNLSDEMETIRFVRSEEKVMERYSPFNGKMILAKSVIYIMEKQLLLVRCGNKRQFEKVTIAGRKLCAALKEIFGPEHPLTKEYLQTVRDDEERYKFLKLRH